MNREEILNAVNEFTLALTDYEKNIVIQRYPGLLDIQTWNYIAESIEYSEHKGLINSARELRKILDYLVLFKSNSKVSKLDSVENLSDENAPDSLWAKSVRLSIGLANTDYLTRAVEEARSAGETEIHHILNNLHSEPDRAETRKILDSANQQYLRLVYNDRRKEAESLALFLLLRDAYLVDEFVNFPPAQQMFYLEKGIEFSDQAIEISKILGEKSCEARFWQIKASGLSNIGQPKEAEAAYERSLEIRRILADAEPQLYNVFVGETLIGLGNIQYQLNDFDSAIDSFQEAVNLFESLDDPQYKVDGVYNTLINLGNLYFYKKEFIKAKNCYLEAIRIYKENQWSDFPEKAFNFAILLNGLGNVRRELGEFIEAEKSYLESLQIKEKLVENRAYAYQDSLAETLNGLGNVQSDLGEFTKAIKNFERSLELYKNLAEERPQIFERYIAIVLHNLGNAQLDIGDFGAAKDSYFSALKIEEKLAETDPFTFETYLAGTNYEIGQMFMVMGEFEEALEYLSESQKIVDETISNYVDLTRRQIVFQKNLHLYKAILFCLLKLGREEEAIEVAERGKSRSLNDHLNLQALRPAISFDETIENKQELEANFQEYSKTIRQSQQIESYLSFIYNDLLQFPPPEAGIAYDNQINERAALETEKQEAEKSLAALRENREFYLSQIRRFDPDFPPRVDGLDFKQILDLSRQMKRAIVIFRILETTTFSFVIYPDRTYKTFENAGFNDNTLKRLVNEYFAPYLDFLNAKFGGEKFVAINKFNDQIPKTLKILFEDLIKPITDSLREKNIEDVVFIPSRGLSILPIQACFDDTENRYLMEDFNIAFATSISLLKKCRESELAEKQTEDSNFLFINNPRENLNFAEDEIRGICEIFDINYETYEYNLIRKKASYQAVIEALKKDYQIIHFSCHGSYNWNEPFTSTLELAGTDSINLKEIMEIRLSNISLVVLSACETGVVDVRDSSDEHYGFPFGFILSGSPSVWGTLWSVDDEATFLLMKKAYNFLKQGKKKSEALNLAQIEMSKDSRYYSPYYWAGFQHYGV